MPVPLTVLIEGYDVRMTVAANGDVALAVDLGFLGWRTFTIPAAEWARMAAYVAAQAKPSHP